MDARDRLRTRFTVRAAEARNDMKTAREGATRRFWFDPRFAVGILLILASVAGVCLLLAAQDRSVQVYVARDALVPGERVNAGDLELANVRVPASARYATPGTLPGGAVVLRSVSKGELVPATAVGNAVDAASTSVVVTASGPVSASVTAGAAVDVWAARSATDKDYAPPTVLVANAVVVSVAHDETLMVDRGSVSVEVRVPAARVASVLQAIADGQILSVVPASPDGTTVRQSAGEGASGPPTSATPAPATGDDRNAVTGDDAGANR